MLIARDRKGLEPPLPHVPGGAVAPMITPHVRGQQPLQITRKLPLGPGPEDQMKVIRHEAKPKHPHRHALAGRPQQREKAAIVRLIVKDLGAGIAAVQHVVAQTTDGSSCGAGHAGSVGTPGGSGKEKSRMSPLFPRGKWRILCLNELFYMQSACSWQMWLWREFQLVVGNSPNRHR